MKLMAYKNKTKIEKNNHTTIKGVLWHICRCCN